MISPEAGSIQKVKGTRRATARVGLMPGRAPIISPPITAMTRTVRLSTVKTWGKNSIRPDNLLFPALRCETSIFW